MRELVLLLLILLAVIFCAHGCVQVDAAEQLRYSKPIVAGGNQDKVDSQGNTNNALELSTSDFTCDGVASNSSSVCSSRGNCTDFNKCSCTPPYFGDNCEIFTCYGKYLNDNEVCSGRGKCIKADYCQCGVIWYGKNCEKVMTFKSSTSISPNKSTRLNAAAGNDFSKSIFVIACFSILLLSFV